MSRFPLLIVCVLVLAPLACDQRSEYELMQMRELARPDTIRTLFLNYTFGMTRQAFFDSSWALNRRGLVTHGPSNLNVQYQLTDELSSAATMLYYPDFENEQITQMQVRFSYDAWAPWNRQLWSDTLIYDVRTLMESWYGDGFITLDKSASGESSVKFVKIDANRQITIQRESDQDVLVIMKDLHTMPANEHE